MKAYEINTYEGSTFCGDQRKSKDRGNAHRVKHKKRCRSVNKCQKEVEG